MKFFIFSLTFLLSFAAFGKGIEKVVQFQKGSHSALLKNSLVRGDVDRYTINAKAGQKMDVSIISLEENAVFQIYLPGGKTLKNAGLSDDAQKWQGILPKSGNYLVVVGSSRGNATYQLKVNIK